MGVVEKIPETKKEAEQKLGQSPTGRYEENERILNRLLQGSN
jgi:hypothetical protein